MGKVAIDWVRARASIVTLVSGLVLLLVQLGKLSPELGEELKTQLGEVLDWVIAGVTIVVVFSGSLQKAWTSMKAPKTGTTKPEGGSVSIKMCVAILFLVALVMLAITTFSGCAMGTTDAAGNKMTFVPPGVECKDGICTVNESAVTKIVNLLSGKKKTKDKDQATTAGKALKQYWPEFDTSYPVVLRSLKPPEK